MPDQIGHQDSLVLEVTEMRRDMFTDLLKPPTFESCKRSRRRSQRSMPWQLICWDVVIDIDLHLVGLVLRIRVTCLVGILKHLRKLRHRVGHYITYRAICVTKDFSDLFNKIYGDCNPQETLPRDECSTWSRGFVARRFHRETAISDHVAGGGLNESRGPCVSIATEASNKVTRRLAKAGSSVLCLFYTHWFILCSGLVFILLQTGQWGNWRPATIFDMLPRRRGQS